MRDDAATRYPEGVNGRGVGCQCQSFAGVQIVHGASTRKPQHLGIHEARSEVGEELVDGCCAVDIEHGLAQDVGRRSDGTAGVVGSERRIRCRSQRDDVCSDGSGSGGAGKDVADGLFDIQLTLLVHTRNLEPVVGQVITAQDHRPGLRQPDAERERSSRDNSFPF